MIFSLLHYSCERKKQNEISILKQVQSLLPESLSVAANVYKIFQNIELSFNFSTVRKYLAVGAKMLMKKWKECYIT